MRVISVNCNECNTLMIPNPVKANGKPRCPIKFDNWGKVYEFWKCPNCGQEVMTVRDSLIT